MSRSAYTGLVSSSTGRVCCEGQVSSLPARGKVNSQMEKSTVFTGVERRYARTMQCACGLTWSDAARGRYCTVAVRLVGGFGLLAEAPTNS